MTPRALKGEEWVPSGRGRDRLAWRGEGGGQTDASRGQLSTSAGTGPRSSSHSSRVVVLETGDLSAHAGDWSEHESEACTQFLSRDFGDQEWVSLNLNYYRSCSPRQRPGSDLEEEKKMEEITP